MTPSSDMIFSFRKLEVVSKNTYVSNYTIIGITTHSKSKVENLVE